MRPNPRVALLAAVLVLLAVTQFAGICSDARRSHAGRPLLQALVLRDAIGELPLGSATPAVFALARSTTSQPAVFSTVPRPPDTVAQQLRVEALLQQASRRLSQVDENGWLAGVALGSQGHYVEAEGQLARAELRLSADPFVSLAMGNVLDEMGRRSSAVETWQMAGLVPAISSQLSRAGTELISRNAQRQAEAVLLLATQLDPASAAAYNILGGFYWGQDSARAAEMYRAALQAGELDPFLDALARGKLALLEGRHLDAVDALVDAQRLQPRHPEANSLLGNALYEAGHTQEAIDSLTEAAALDESSPWPLMKLGQIYLERGEFDRAAEAAADAVGRRPDLVPAFDLLGQAYRGAGRPQDAAAAWQQAVALEPNQVAHRLRYADALLEAGQLDLARAAYEGALELDPFNARAAGQLERLAEQDESAP